MYHLSPTQRLLPIVACPTKTWVISLIEICANHCAMQIHRLYAYGDSEVISLPAGFRRHLVGKTVINVFHCDIAEIRFVGELVIIQIFS